MVLTSLQVRGYRCLADVEIPLRSPMVLIGPNGSGKSAVLEVFTLLRDAAREQLRESLAERGGINDILFAGGVDSLAVRVGAKAEDGRELEYTLELGREGRGYVIKKEILAEGKHPELRAPFYIHNVPGRWRYFDPIRGEEGEAHLHLTDTALSQLPRTFPEVAVFRELFEQTRLYHNLDISARSFVRLPQTLQPVSLPGPNGEDLYAALYNVRATDEATFERIQEALRTAFPGFRRLEFPIVGAGQATLTWYQQGFDKSFYPNQLSEGTLRFLWLATILLSPRLPAITLIDEPEVSLHPELLMILAGLIREAALRTQIIVATHADQLVRWLEPTEVVVADIEGGQTRLTWADTLDLGDWLKKYTLSELWLMGELGGRP